MNDADDGHRVQLRRWLGYGLIWLALIGAIGVTLALAYVPLGKAQSPAHLGIAATQAALIWVFFMNLRRASGLVRLAAGSATLWLIFMFALTFNDYLSR